ncbi:MAG: hypothetical protein LKF01_02355 [Lactobacillus sp.]|jgi:cytochrome c-type biogenesis protein CcmH/NrfF|nr:hypothetical protein [Lactobacillus sp.]MCH3905517.1 hypothetical protein [Lactobacillus sp.]MCH3990915.1 hypothetical protein [Lactobacillus sp.]MCH4068369.1 hypothetical protein [Lactobacillus sp.]MCI1304382.1 hypothetical protein [Lactobacillus sp.]
MSNTIFWAILLTCLLAMGAAIYYASKKRKFDERQEMIRLRSYKYGFSTMAILAVIILFLSEFIKIPIALAIIIPLVASLWVMCIYDILHSAYFGFNEKNTKVTNWLTIVWGLWIILDPITEGQAILSWEGIATLVVGLFLISISILSLYQLHREHKEDAAK